MQFIELDIREIPDARAEIYSLTFRQAAVEKVKISDHIRIPYLRSEL